MSDDSRLTDDERKVIGFLADAWNLYATLPIQHPMHQQEFATNIHQLQRLVMSRPTARIEGWVVPVKPQYKLEDLD